MVSSGMCYCLLPSISKLIVYDAAGNRTSLTAKASDSQKDLLWTYQYDSLNRLSSQTDWRNQSYTYTYDELSRRTSLTRPNGVKTEYTYDNASQLTSIVHKDENEAVVLGIAYEYDAAGNRTAITYTGLHPTLHGRHTYSYDSLNRLISADHPTGSILPDESYTYDAVGNRTSSHLSTTYVYNTANRLLSDDQYTYTYDSVGNLFDRTRKNDPTKVLRIRTEGSALFVMDRWTDENGKKRALFQDSLMRKVQEADQVGGTLTRKRSWLHDNEDWVVELEQTVVGNQNVIDVAKVVTHGPGIDEPIMLSTRNDLMPTLLVGPGGFLTCASCMQDSYPLTDALGSVLALVDSSGTLLVQTYAYDSFGRVLFNAGGIPNDYGYTGRELDRTTGMMFYRNRWYEPSLGRFVGEDPNRLVGLRLGGYAYANNNPGIYGDPFGLIYLWMVPQPVINNAKSIINEVTGGAFTPEELDSVAEEIIDQTSVFDVSEAMSLARTASVNGVVCLTPAQEKYIRKTIKKCIKKSKKEASKQTCKKAEEELDKAVAAGRVIVCRKCK